MPSRGPPGHSRRWNTAFRVGDRSKDRCATIARAWLVLVTQGARFQPGNIGRGDACVAHQPNHPAPIAGNGHSATGHEEALVVRHG